MFAWGKPEFSKNAEMLIHDLTLAYILDRPLLLLPHDSVRLQ